MRLGARKADPERYAGALAMGRFLDSSTTPVHPLAVDYFAAVTAWNLGRNDKFGTCGPTYVSNAALHVSTVLTGAGVRFTDDEIIDLYRRSGNPNFDPKTGAGDNGVDMTVMLSEVVKNGIGFGDRNTKAVAYAAFDSTDTDKLWLAGALFGGVGWGADLRQAQQKQTNVGLWDYTARSVEWGGHAIYAAGTYSDVAGTAGDRTKLVTWARVIASTVAFIQNQVQESYILLWPWHLQSKTFLANTDLATLAVDFTAITGKPFPANVPTPPPPPAPAPTSAPSDAQMWAIAKLWAAGKDLD
jgi:hypothetical protein